MDLVWLSTASSYLYPCNIGRTVWLRTAPSVFFFIIVGSSHFCIISSSYHWIIVSLYYGIIVLLYHCASLYHCIVVSLYHFALFYHHCIKFCVILSSLYHLCYLSLLYHLCYFIIIVSFVLFYGSYHFKIPCLCTRVSSRNNHFYLVVIFVIQTNSLWLSSDLCLCLCLCFIGPLLTRKSTVAFFVDSRANAETRVRHLFVYLSLLFDQWWNIRRHH